MGLRRGSRRRDYGASFGWFKLAPLDRILNLQTTCRNDEITRILTKVVEIGLRGGWAEFEETPLRLPRIQLDVGRRPRPPPPSDSDGTDSGSSSSDNGTNITSGP